MYISRSGEPGNKATLASCERVQPSFLLLYLSMVLSAVYVYIYATYKQSWLKTDNDCT